MHRKTPDRATIALGYQCIRAPARSDDEHVGRQARAIEEFCRRREWDLVAVIRDVEPARRKAAGQPALTNAIERLRSGDAGCLVVADLRQLCASVAELGPILDAIDHADARLVSLEPAFDTATPIGHTIGRMLVTVSGWERERRSEMTSAARSKAGDTPAIPAKLKRRIVRMRDAGMTLQAIADQLNDERVPTIRGGAEWRPSSVQATLGYKRPQRWGGSEEGEFLRS